MNAQSHEKVSVATVWLDGCSGCHMSFLDMDERLIELADLIDIVYSPFVDKKIFPEQVDLTLVEGSVSSDEDLSKIKKIRQRTRQFYIRMFYTVHKKLYYQLLSPW